MEQSIAPLYNGTIYSSGEVCTSQIRDFQKAAVDKVEFRQRLKSYGDQPVQEVLDLVKSWEKIVE
jgi:hypothetical protein